MVSSCFMIVQEENIRLQPEQPWVKISTDAGGFDPADVGFDKGGLTALGCYALSDHAKDHGVFCPGDDETVDIYLQKPTLEQQDGKGTMTKVGEERSEVL